jgi:hypothetical protein
MTAVELLAAAREKGPWTVQPDGRIRNAYRECPRDPWEFARIVEAADLPGSKHRAWLMQGLGLRV